MDVALYSVLAVAWCPAQAEIRCFGGDELVVLFTPPRRQPREFFEVLNRHLSIRRRKALVVFRRPLAKSTILVHQSFRLARGRDTSHFFLRVLCDTP